MTPAAEYPVRRVSITLSRWPLGLHAWVRPTIIIEGRAQPSQWGEGTWQVPADRPTTVGVFLYTRGITWGRAEHELLPGDEPRLTYRFGWCRGRFIGV